MDWDARLSTIPRRQGRRGRHYDFAQWYPRIAVYDRGGWEQHPLHAAGRVLRRVRRLRRDAGPGRRPGDRRHRRARGGRPRLAARPPRRARARSCTSATATRRSPRRPLGLLAGQPAPGRKRVRWRAERRAPLRLEHRPDVHLRAGQRAAAGPRRRGPSPSTCSTSPATPPGTRAWPWSARAGCSPGCRGSTAPTTGRSSPTCTASSAAGTEFPMMVMDGSASEGLIAHEGSHQFTYGMLGNNQWKSGWLDEGFASFTRHLVRRGPGRDGRLGRAPCRGCASLGARGPHPARGHAGRASSATTPPTRR